MQLTALIVSFFLYTTNVMRPSQKRGYLLGWLIALFVVFVYGSLFPPNQLGFDAEIVTLSIFQVMVACLLGFMASIVMVLASVAFPESRVRQALSASLIAAIFVTAIFFQIIASAEVRLMISLFVLAFGMGILASVIATQEKQRQSEAHTLRHENDDQTAARRQRAEERVGSSLLRRLRLKRGETVRTTAVDNRLRGRQHINRIAARHQDQPIEPHTQGVQNV